MGNPKTGRQRLRERGREKKKGTHTDGHRYRKRYINDIIQIGQVYTYMEYIYINKQIYIYIHILFIHTEFMDI